MPCPYRSQSSSLTVWWFWSPTTSSSQSSPYSWRMNLLGRNIQDLLWGQSINFYEMELMIYTNHYLYPVWKAWQIFQNLKFHQMSKRKNNTENWIFGSFCSFGSTWGSEISFPYLQITNGTQCKIMQYECETKMDFIWCMSDFFKK